MEAQFDADVRLAVESVMRTPEHNRPATPLPELHPGDIDDGWLDDSPPAPVIKVSMRMQLAVYCICHLISPVQ